MDRIREALARLVGRPRRVQVARGFPGAPVHHGFVAGLGRDLVLIQQFHDFYPEGYAALRVADVRRVRSGARERFWGRMFRGEGLMDRVGIPLAVPLDDFRALLADLRGRGQHLIIEAEDRRAEGRDDFHIGRIVDLDDRSVAIRNFDALGAWDDTPAVVGLAAITQVQFDTPYINTLSKYLGGAAPGP